MEQYKILVSIQLIEAKSLIGNAGEKRTLDLNGKIN